MASTAAQPGNIGKATKPVSAADRIKTPPFKPTNGITRKQIDKVVRDIMARREAQPRG